MDFVFIALVGVFFALSALLVVGFDKLRGHE
jgi:hypothetical protein